MKQHASISVMSRWLFALLIPVTLLMGFIGIHQVGEAYRAEQDRTEQEFDQTIDRWQGALEKLELYVSNLLQQSTVVQELNYTADPVRTLLRKREVYANFGTCFSMDSNAMILALYCGDSENYVERDNSLTRLDTRSKLAMRAEICQLMKDCCQGQIGSGGWQVFQTGDTLLLYAVQKLGNTYGFCAVNLQSLFADGFRGADIAVTSGGIVYTYGESFSARAVEENAGRYAAYSRDFYGLQVSATSQNNPSLQKSAVWTILLAMTALLAACVSTVYWFRWNHLILQPLETLKQTMQAIQNGNLERRASDEKAGREIQEVNETFNLMLEQINHLKIKSYEKELLARKTQLEYYRLQIRPHFYLNCMKNMYALASKGDTAKLEKSILLTSEYLRHTMQNVEHAITLREEIQQCSNYVELIGVSSSYPLSLACKVDESAREIVIPAVSILTFVENSIKHGAKSNQPLHIEITASMLNTEAERYLNLRIHDSGKGISDELLEQLNKQDWEQNTGTHIGLRNVARRFQLMFGSMPHISFYNDRGAVVEVFVPLQEEGV